MFWDKTLQKRITELRYILDSLRYSLLFLGRREEGEGVVHTNVSGDSRTEKCRFHETFLIFLKKTNNSENVALKEVCNLHITATNEHQIHTKLLI